METTNFVKVFMFTSDKDVESFVWNQFIHNNELQNKFKETLFRQYVREDNEKLKTILEQNKIKFSVDTKCNATEYSEDIHMIPPSEDDSGLLNEEQPKPKSYASILNTNNDQKHKQEKFNSINIQTLQDIENVQDWHQASEDEIKEEKIVPFVKIPIIKFNTKNGPFVPKKAIKNQETYISEYHLDIKINNVPSDFNLNNEDFKDTIIDELQKAVDIFYTNYILQFANQYVEKPVFIKEFSTILPKPKEISVSGIKIRCYTQTLNQCRTIQKWALFEGREIIQKICFDNMKSMQKDLIKYEQRRIYNETYMNKENFDAFVDNGEELIPNYNEVGIQMFVSKYLQQKFPIDMMFVFSVQLPRMV